MIPLIDILIILFSISLAQAGPLRRYANTTSQTLHVATGVAYQPYAGSPSLSLAPIQGITTLPFSQVAETPAAAPVASCLMTSSLLSDTPTTTAISQATFSYQPERSNTCSSTAITTSTTLDNDSQANQNGAPTSFWTFGDQQHTGTTVTSTITSTSTTYTTITAPAAAAAEPEPTQGSEGASRAQNATTTGLTRGASRTFFSFDPLSKTTTLPTTGSESTATSSATSTIAASSSSNASTLDPMSTSTFDYPYPRPLSTTASTMSTASTHSPIQQTSNADSASTTSANLPVVVTGSVSATQSQASLVTSNTTAVVPGITIVPQNPSVVYITVTDAGATTTVTA